MDCLFCKIAAGTIPVTRIYEDDLCLAFPDINPQAPTHILIIPKQHITSLAHATPEDTSILGHLLATAATIATQQNLTNGYRTVINTGPDGGQTVHHLHLHLLGGRPMHWPPG
jgi:histidine triad (HIT) family protein